jgi:hypothetical protein
MKALKAALYRVRQAIWALSAQWRPLDLRALDEYLSQEQRKLFLEMSRSDQRHSLAVFEYLQKNGSGDRALLQAALLHDIGKVEGQVRLWHRVIIVLIRAFSPKLLIRLARDRIGSWRYPLFLYLEHARLSGERARLAGVSSEVESLIREHHDAAPSMSEGAFARKLRALQRADSAN